MKKLLITLCVVLLLTATLSPVCAAADNFDTLADWNVRVAVPDGATAVLKGNEYYIYAQSPGYIPYVMLTVYRYDSEEEFIEAFTEFMQKKHADLQVTAEAAPVTIGGKDCWEIDYAYQISGYDATDRRVVMNVGGLTYMFCAKEIESRGATVGTMLEDVIAGCVFLSEDGEELPGLENEDADLSVAYLYCQDDGMPKYWLDLSGVMVNNLVLHCYFRSGEPTFYEQDFILDLQTADITDTRIDIHNVYTMDGTDCSAWFKKLSLTLSRGAMTMTVQRDSATLAGGADDNILTGRYKMESVWAGFLYEYHQEDGMLKYWLDVNDEDGTVLLHAMFRSGDPWFYEEIFDLDMETAELDGDTIVVRKVFNSMGEDVSRWFKSLTIRQEGNALVLSVTRDESTLAGGPEDNILTGEYVFNTRTYLLPAGDGPYTAEEMARWARIRYFDRNGFFPPEAEAEDNGNGTITIHLYEIVGIDGMEHTATSAWYTVDEYGVGYNDITEEPVRLCD